MPRFVLAFLLFFPLPGLYLHANDSMLPNTLSSGNTNRDSILSRPKWTKSVYFRQSIVPASLTVTSLSILCIPDLKYRIQEALNWNKSETIVLYDDYLRYVPTGALALLSVCGVKGRHSILQEIALVGTSYVLADFCVFRIKAATKVTRPNPEYGNESYPSQHASMAFVAATLLHREFGHISPWISVGGYATATWVAYSRIARNRHFLPDVLLGSAIGIFSTNATYWVYDALFPKCSNVISLSPILSKEGAEMLLCYRF
jgi:membrane-associated phospholipid phosphatase